MFDVFVGHDPREDRAFRVCLRSIAAHGQEVALDVRPLIAGHLAALGLYPRPVIRAGNALWDVQSEAPAATEFATTRFLVPWLSRSPWALFCDADFLFTRNLAELFGHADPRYAVQVVKHAPQAGGGVKMDGQTQTAYERKNWSSLILWNVNHPAHNRLTLRDVSALPGRDLHRFCWLGDEEIGALPHEWNWLVGVDGEPAVLPSGLHYTLGTPDMPGCAGAPYADRWFETLADLEGVADLEGLPDRKALYR